MLKKLTITLVLSGALLSLAPLPAPAQKSAPKALPAPQVRLHVGDKTETIQDNLQKPAAIKEETATEKQITGSKEVDKYLIQVKTLEGKDSITVVAKIAGLRQGRLAVDVIVRADEMTISGAQTTAETNNQGRGRGELVTTSGDSSFHRTFSLPAQIELTGVKAGLQGEEITVYLPKKPQANGESM